MLKLLALQVLKECEVHIRRCLEPGLMYYLCQDYDISKTSYGEWLVSRNDAYVNNVDERFFRILPKSKFNINISAVVGENGSGKSTIVELILRMINNCAIKFNIRTERDSLVYVKGVHARLFYMSGKYIYCLSIAGEKESVAVREIATLEDGLISPSGKSLSEDKVREHFFYTFVSNYSHYAYNTHDFRIEWQKKSDEDTCWLKWLFHKNDRYQLPITLHPYRDQGTIDIERERNLSNQRLLYFFINSVKQKSKHGVFNHINGKKPKYLNLREVESSNLQDVTILDYFRECRNVNLLEDQLRLLKEYQAEYGNQTNKQLPDFQSKIIKPLEEVIEMIMGNEEHVHFFGTMTEWLENQNRTIKKADDKILSGRSDLKMILDELEGLEMRLLYEIGLYEDVADLCDRLRPFERLNICQLQRLEILDDVCYFWKGRTRKDKIPAWMQFELTPWTIKTASKKLTLEERCYHYIVYKTIDILETDPSYHYPLWAYQKSAVHFSRKGSYRESKKMIQLALDQLIEDVLQTKTHITLKMRQAFYYLNHNVKNGEDDYSIKGESVANVDGFCLSSESLKELFADGHNMEALPPPIYERHLLFETKEGKLVDLDTFSSGEKQLLNTQSAIIYHLQNLNSIFKDTSRIKYSQVNIILEEIELYFHPEYQRCFIYNLINLLENTNISDNIKDVNVLIVTHSPFILSDIPKCNVLFLEEGKPNSKMQENTFGSNIHSLLKNGFFLPSLPIGEFAHQKINAMFERLNNARVDRENNKEKMLLYSDITKVGEPYLREQLMRLFNMYYPPYYYDRS